MPLIKLIVSNAVEEDKRGPLLKNLSRLLAEGTGKPEQYVMAILETESMIMAAGEGNAAFADVRGIGLGGDAIPRLSRKICDFLARDLGIPPERVYLNFTSVPADRWGWNGTTFG